MSNMMAEEIAPVAAKVDAAGPPSFPRANAT